MNDRKRTENTSTLGQAIDKIMKAYRLDGKMKEIEILSKWPELMGVAVANRTENLFIKNNILHLKLNSSVMRDELLNGKTVIIQRVNQAAGFELIKDVWFS
jgi:hypothetical protein